MIGLFCMLGVALSLDPVAHETIAKAEMQRALEGLKLPNQAVPHHITVTVSTGHFSSVRAQDGAITSSQSGPSRDLRVDVRVGDSNFDNGNFRPSMGIPDGVFSRRPADEYSDLSFQRELWLALDAAYKGATQTYAAKEAAREGRDGPFAPDLLPIDAPTVLPYRAHRTTDETALTTLVSRLATQTAAPEHLEDSALAAGDWAGSGLVMTSEGTTAWIPTSFTIVRAEMIARAQDGSRLRNTRSWVAASPEHLPSIDEMIESVNEATAWLKTLHDAPIEEDYLGPVLFEAPAAAELFRQVLHPEISGTPPWEYAPDSSDSDTRPIPVSRIGRRLLPAGWRVWDDPTENPQLASHYTHDYEGVPARRVDAIHDGVLRDVLMSRVPRTDRNKSTGHGRSSGLSRRVAMPAQVTVKPRKTMPLSRMQRVALRHAKSAGNDYVLVVRRLVPPALSEDFEFAFTGDGPLAGLTPPSEVHRLYPDGRIEPVRGLRFSGVDRRSLRDIIAASATHASVEMNDSAEQSARFSLADLGGHPVSWAVPSVVIGEMELRGAGGGEARIISAP